MMLIPYLQIDNVFKNFGNNRVLNEISFRLKPGEIMGIIGPNGAGKTTLLRIIATVLTPNKGSIFFNGINIHDSGIRIRQIIGYLPEDAGFYNRLSAIENLKFFLSFYFVSDQEAKIENNLRKFDLLKLKDIPVGKYSQGMRRKLLFIRSIIHEPEIILLDEPFITMDPEAHQICVRLLKELSIEKKSCILICSHSLRELENICDHILFLSQGCILFNKRVNILQKQFGELGIHDLEEYYLRIVKNDQSVKNQDFTD